MALIELPPRRILLFIVILSVVNPLNYLIMLATAPNDTVFVGSVDDILQLTLMNSAKTGFEDPWYFGSVFSNPVIGSPFTYIALGTPLALLGLNSLTAFIIIKFVLSLVFLVVLYNFIKFFAKEKTGLWFVFVSLSAGVGWLVYGISFLVYGNHYTPIAGYLLTSEFTELGGGAHILQHLTRIYWMISEIFGLLSMLYFFRSRKIMAGISLGLAALFYPLFGFAFAAFILLYAVVTEKIPKGFLRKLIPVLLTAVPFGAVWGLIYISNPSGIELYKTVEWSGFSSKPLLTVIVSNFFALFFAGYYWLKKEKKQIIALLALLILLVPFTLVNIYEFISRGGNSLAKEWLGSVGIENLSRTIWQNSLPLETVFFLVLAFFGYTVYAKWREKSYPFLWILLVVFLTTVSARWVPWWPARYGWFMIYPAVIASIPGVKKFVENHHPKWKLITEKNIVLAVIILSLPSMLAFNIHFQQVAHRGEYSYVQSSDFHALTFLAAQPKGRVIAWYPIDQIVPYYTGQNSVIIAPLNEKKTEDIKLLYSGNASESEVKKILEAYGVDYVFVGTHEKGLGSVDFNLTFLEKIYSDGTEIYRVVRS